MIQDFFESAAREIVASAFEGLACIWVGRFGSLFGIV